MALGPRHVAPEILAKVTKALGVTALDQWYYVPHQALTQAIGVRVLNSFGGLVGFLKSAYPQHHFDEEKLTVRKNQEREQKFIEVAIRKLFPNTEIHTKARKAVGILNPGTGAYLEIDVWIPSLKLGFEYQDKHHYAYQWYANEALEVYQKRDEVKKDTMHALGYTLITIGYWWDKTIESLIATIQKFRPDLLHEYKNISVDPIPSELPPDLVTAAPVIPGISGIMSPFVPTNDFDPTNWYAGEKYDGIRGVYNPELNKIFSRSGNELSVLPSLLQDIPNMLVEGEIIAGRNNYNKTTAVSYHSHHDKVNWPMFRYVLYDIPNAELGNYTERYSVITNELLARPFVFAQSAFRVLISNKPHLKMLVDTIVNDAGEGVIVQKDAQYEYGRAKGLAKIKLRRDADAKVLSVHKYLCTCKLVNGVTADIVFSDDFDQNKLKVGDIISYYHNGYAQNGQPKKAEIYKVRYDVNWEKIISEEEPVAKRRSVKEALGGGSLIARNSVRNKMGYWNKLSNVRAFFDEFARTLGFDPLAPEKWYRVRMSSVQNSGGSGLLKVYGYNLYKALSGAYPELQFDPTKFKTRDKARANVRTYFDDFAHTAGFDPLVRENWYSAALQEVAIDILDAYSYDIKKALRFAYPELRFEATKFNIYDTMRARSKMKHGHWNKSPNIRAFFDEFARTSGFDPLVPKNWYSIRTTDLRKAEGRGLLKAYSLTKGLVRAYPELKFELEKFRTRETTRARSKNGHWNKLSNVRAFFDEFARTSGFDPLAPDNWYPVRIRTLKNAGGCGLFTVYNYNLKKALIHAYPEVKFEVDKFRTRDKTR